MKKPYHKNILFIGDAAGRGIFFGPRIEGLNVGMDDAVRASFAIARSLDKNNFDSNYLGESYTQSIEESPYTLDMKKIDREYLNVILKNTRKEIPSNILGAKYKILLNIASNNFIRNFFISLLNKYGYTRLLSLIESDDVYFKIPIDIANKLGRRTVKLADSFQPADDIGDVTAENPAVCMQFVNDDILQIFKQLHPFCMMRQDRCM